MERKAAQVAGYLLFLLSAYVLLQAIFGLTIRHAAETSPIGIAVALIAAFGMPFLAKAKLRVAALIDSRSLRADAMETLTCGYLAWVLLIGVVLNAVTHWWWIDSVASLALVPLLIREGYEAVSDRGFSFQQRAGFHRSVTAREGRRRTEEGRVFIARAGPHLHRCERQIS